MSETVTFCVDCNQTAGPYCVAYHDTRTTQMVFEIGKPEPPAPRAGERDARQWHVSSESRSENGDATISAGVEWIGQVKRKHAAQIVTEHNQHATLIEQREQLLRLLRPVTSPTACYCAVMKDEKCWHCEARELIATIEREGEVR